MSGCYGNFTSAMRLCCVQEVCFLEIFAASIGSESERWLQDSSIWWTGPPVPTLFILEWAAASWMEGDGLQWQLQDQSLAGRPRIQFRIDACIHPYPETPDRRELDYSWLGP